MTPWLTLAIARSSQDEPFYLRSVIIRSYLLGARTVEGAQREAELVALRIVRHAYTMLE